MEEVVGACRQHALKFCVVAQEQQGKAGDQSEPWAAQHNTSKCSVNLSPAAVSCFKLSRS